MSEKRRHFALYTVLSLPSTTTIEVNVWQILFQLEDVSGAKSSDKFHPLSSQRCICSSLKWAAVVMVVSFATLAIQSSDDEGATIAKSFPAAAAAHFYIIFCQHLEIHDGMSNTTTLISS